MNEPNVTDALLTSLLQLDESFRNGTTTDTLAPSDDAEFLKQIELGRAALAELEAAIPRRSHVIPSWAPQTIGRFEIRSVLGSGGFAVVYLAYDPRLGRTVALKIPRPHALVHPELRRNFVTEAKAAAKLDHPNIVPVYEAGEDRDVPYIACACCEGPTLASWFASRTTPMKPTLAAMIVRQLASAVQFSHERGVLHRDIKPGNVLLFPEAPGVDDSFPYTARLGDFGLAKLMESDPSDTVTSLLIGTPSYMAPEIVSGTGRSGDVTPDVYALGAVLYYLIVGQAPFSAATISESLRQIVDCDAVSPDVVNPAACRDLSLICMKCLQKLPSHRYASAAALATDLNRFLAGEPVHARQTPVALRIQKWCRRHPAVAALIAVSVSLSAVLLVLAARYTVSLQDLQGQLLNSNDQLKQRVGELNSAINTANLHEAQSEKNRRIAEEQAFAADLRTADSLRLAGDLLAANRILDQYATPESLPGNTDGNGSFAWRYLKARTRTAGTALSDTGQIAWHMQLSPDGRRIALCGDKGIIRILDAQQYQTLNEYHVATTELNCVVWSDNNSILAASGDDGAIRICDSDSLEVLRTFDAIRGGKAFGLAFLPGTTHLIVSGESSDLQLWDTASGQLLKTVVTPHDRGIESIDVSADGKQLVTGGDDSRMCMFQCDDLSHMWTKDVTHDVESGPVSVVRFTPDGKYLAVCGVKKAVFLCNAATGETLRSWTGIDKILAMAVDTDRIVCGDERGLLSEFNIQDNVQEWLPQKQWLGHQAKVSSIIFCSKHTTDGYGSPLLSAGRQQELRLWPAQRQSPDIEFPGTQSGGNWTKHAICWINSTTLLRGNASGVDRLDINSREPQQLVSSSSPVTCCQYAANAKCLIIGNQRGEVTVVPDGQEPLPPISVFNDALIGNLNVDSAATRVVVQGSNDEVVVIDLQNRRILSRLSDGDACPVSPDGRWVTCRRRKTGLVEIFDARTMTFLQNLPDQNPPQVNMDFTPDSRRLLTTSHDRMISFWDTSSWTAISHFATQARAISMIATHPDQTTFATADSDGYVRLWDVTTGRQLVELGQFAEHIYGLSFSPNGESLAVCHGNLEVKVIRVSE